MGMKFLGEPGSVMSIEDALDLGLIEIDGDDNEGPSLAEEKVIVMEDEES